MYVTTVAPDQTLHLMRDEIDELQNELVDPAGLRRLVLQFITDYFLKNETNADQANFLARAALYEGDYRAGETGYIHGENSASSSHGVRYTFPRRYFQDSRDDRSLDCRITTSPRLDRDGHFFRSFDFAAPVIE